VVRRVDIYLHVPLTSTLNGGEWSASRSGCFTHGENLGFHWIRHWMEHRTPLNSSKRKSLLPLPRFESQTSTPVASSLSSLRCTMYQEFPSPKRNCGASVRSVHWPTLVLRVGQVNCWVRCDWILLFVLCWYTGNVQPLSAGRRLGKQSWLGKRRLHVQLSAHSFIHLVIHSFLHSPSLVIYFSGDRFLFGDPTKPKVGRHTF